MSAKGETQFTSEDLVNLRQEAEQRRLEAEKKRKGLYGKFAVQRTDGKDEPGGKHFKCAYFVLDVTHDRLAVPALRAYADAAWAAGYYPLARDLRAVADDAERMADLSLKSNC